MSPKPNFENDAAEDDASNVGPPPSRSSMNESKIALFIDFENIAIGVTDAKYKKFEVNLLLERLLEKIVDTPVRGVVYEAVGSVDSAVLAGGAELGGTASRTWRIPVRVAIAEQNDPDEWSEEMVDMALGLLSLAGETK